MYADDRDYAARSNDYSPPRRGSDHVADLRESSRGSPTPPRYDRDSSHSRDYREESYTSRLILREEHQPSSSHK